LDAFPASSKCEQVTRVEGVLSAFKELCCDHMCTFKFSVLDVAALCCPFRDFSHKQWTCWIQERIRGALLTDGSYNFVVSGVTTCKHGFCLLYGISDYKFKSSLDGVDSVTQKKHKHMLKKKDWKINLWNWLMCFIASYSDPSPTSENRYLPVYFTREIVFNLAKKHLESSGLTIGLSSFTKLWKDEYAEVKFAKSFRMGSCDFCLLLKRIKRNSVTITEQDQELAKHTKLHSEARAYCTKMKLKSISQPFKIMYLQYDGKKASHLPHIVPLPKDTQNLARIKTNVYGLLDFSQNVSRSYVFFPHWECGPNISLTILYDHIVRTFQTMNHKRPKTLVLQVDNCCKEGKNRTVFAFAAHLVHFGWFKKVKIVSLIQGHTHDLIDQTFSVWTTGEHRNCIESLGKLGGFMSRAYREKKTVPSFTVLRRVFN